MKERPANKFPSTSDSDNWFELERLHRAVQDGDLKQLAELVGAGFELNMFDDLGRMPLHYAVEGEHYLATKWLLDNGAQVNTYDEDTIGETPLGLAVRGNYPELVELLLAHGADPDIPGWMGLTARMRADRRSDEDGHAISALFKKTAVRP